MCDKEWFYWFLFRSLSKLNESKRLNRRPFTGECLWFAPIFSPVCLSSICLVSFELEPLIRFKFLGIRDSERRERRGRIQHFTRWHISRRISSLSWSSYISRAFLEYLLHCRINSRFKLCRIELLKWNGFVKLFLFIFGKWWKQHWIGKTSFEVLECKHVLEFVRALTWPSKELPW